jgi:polyhydroxybutyrate depolymerase
VKNSRFSLSLFIALAFLLGSSACEKSASPSAMPTPAATLQYGDSQRTLTVDGMQRNYLLHIPPGLPSNQPAALVFVFHGYSETASLIQQTSGFNDISDKGGFIVVYPNGSGPGSGQSWNAVGCCGYAIQHNIDDQAFIRWIISDVDTLTKIDPKQIYATGFSNGALLSYRLACEMSDTFAAVAPVAGVLISTPCLPTQPVAVIDFHGLTDNVVPYAGGGVVPGSGQPFPPVEKSIAHWANLDGCADSPQVEQTAVFTHTTYTSCQSGSAVELYAVKGIGHSWPSQYVVPASQLIWDFFKAHPRQ